MTVQITAGQFHAADGVGDWRSLYHLVSAHFRTGSLTEGIALVDEIGRLAGEAEQPCLNLDLRPAGVTVSLSRRDIALARRISAAAEALDIPADPARRGPGFGLQRMNAARPHRNRLHLDIAVPHDQAEARVTAALAAGGHLVSDAHAPKWWVLADAEGNEACVATWVGRE
jgi:4a-hydroxytetrahydrobiopterin dehydratase